MTTHPGLMRRRLALFAVAAATSVGLVLGTGLAAEAATLSLGPSVAYSTKTYYTTPRYKAATGTASFNYTANTGTCSVIKPINIGFRTNASTGSGESTQFPSVTLGNTVAFRNVQAPPSLSTQFSAGYYYFTAQDLCSGASWSGVVTW
jgi:hypothetical protein